MRCVALLRGINVGGRNLVAMADLRALVSRSGHSDVTTHLQSGNALFTTARRDTDALAHELEQRMRDDWGRELPVLVRSHAELARVLADNPLRAQAVAQPSRFLVVFLAGAPPDPLPAASSPDVVAPGERCVYASLPEGIHSSRTARALTDARLGMTATGRNWTTVTALADLTDD